MLLTREGTLPSLYSRMRFPRRGNSCTYLASYARPPPAEARSVLRRGRTAPSRAPRTERTAGHSASPGGQPGGHSAGRAYKPARRLSNGNAENGVPESATKARSACLNARRTLAKPGLGPSFRPSFKRLPRVAPSRRLARISPRASLPAGKGILTFTPNRCNAGKPRPWPGRGSNSSPSPTSSSP